MTGLKKNLNFSVVSVIIAVFLLIPFLPSVYADDKNGVSPNTISLPTGPGSIEGLGGSFQPFLNTGMAGYSVDIALPANVNGHAPGLSLKYNSGTGYGLAGTGWSFEPGCISRQTEKGLPGYVDVADGIDNDHDGEIDEADEIDRFIGPDGEELVNTSGLLYRARIEGSFVLYKKIGAHWEASLKNGTKLIFGESEQARVMDATGAKIYQWLLETSTDINGNVIRYAYSEFSGSENRKYLSEIRYGAGSNPSAFYFVSLTYADRPDDRDDYRSGFNIRTTKRLETISVCVEGALSENIPGLATGDWNSNGTQDALIRKYKLTYDDTAAYLSFLSNITQYGADNNDANYLPPVRFSYDITPPAVTTSATDYTTGSVNPPSSVMDHSAVDFIDINNDGLPDILNTGTGGSANFHKAYINQGPVSSEDQTVSWSDETYLTGDDGFSISRSITSAQTHFADMNGDGVSDLVHTDTFGNVSWHQNKKETGWGPRQAMSVQDTAPPAPFTNDDVKTADLNFDKRIDIIKSGEYGYYVWLNLGGGKYSKKVQTNGAYHNGQALLFSDSRVRLEDINGDRLSDIAKITGEKVIYCPAKGFGEFDTSKEIAIPDYLLSDIQISRAQLKDINGDGLADLVIERAATQQLWYWLNTGESTFSPRHVITDMPGNYDNMVVRWADVNGNGSADIIYADSSMGDNEKLRIVDIGKIVTGGKSPNLLTSIENGLGVTTTIGYKSSTDDYVAAEQSGTPWEITLPKPVAVVGSITTTTGLNVDTIPGNDRYLKDFTYRDGYYDDNEKAFRGFSDVRVTEHGDETSPTHITVHNFHTGRPDGIDNDGDGQNDEISASGYREEDALKGLPLDVTVQTEDEKIFNKDINNWNIKTLMTGVNGVEVRCARNNEVNKWVYEKTDTPKQLTTTFIYDDFGNMLEEKNYGAVSLSDDEAFTFNEYINDEASWLIGFQKKTYTTDAAGKKITETRYYYDGDDYVGLGYGFIEKGLLTRTEAWEKDSDYTNQIRNKFDIYGNITDTKDPEDNQRTVEYDEQFHTYPVREKINTDTMDLSVSVRYNTGFGLILESTDFNGHVATYSYDTFGRISGLIKQGDSEAFPTASYIYRLADPENSLLYSYDKKGELTLTTDVATPGSIETKVRKKFGLPDTQDTLLYIDGMGRQLAIVAEDETGFIINEAVLFNARNGIRYQFLPYHSENSSYSVPPVILNEKTEIHYDATGKTVRQFTPPDNNGTVHFLSNQYLPLKMIITDENLKNKEKFFDGLGRVINVLEHNLGEIYTTNYQYDPSGNLKILTDAYNNVTEMTYDGLGRKVTSSDPDMGFQSFIYDNAGNLKRFTDNKGQVTEYTYDGANRKLTEDYLDAANITPDVSYHYDTPSTEYHEFRNTMGKLAYVKDLSGGQFFSYDNRKNIETSIKRIDLDGNGTTNDFRYNIKYDSMGRVTGNSFPDGDEVDYFYNNKGLISSIPGIVKTIGYQVSGKYESITYANDIKTGYRYDPRMRLTELETLDSGNGNSILQDLSYVMDGIGNITSITDERLLPPDSPDNATQSFGYDDLYRLTSATGAGYGTINYHYDAIGNLTWKKSPDALDTGHIDDTLINTGDMIYGGTSGTANRNGREPGDQPGPHALTSTQSGQSYTYDDNGNMKANSDGDIYSWDFQDRPVSIQKGTVVSEYIYDYTGRRVVKRVTDGNEIKHTYYISENYEIQSGKTVKYVFDGNKRIARIEGKIAVPEGPVQQALIFKPGWNFFTLGVEPENADISNVLGSIAGAYTEIWAFDTPSGNYQGYVPSEGVNELTELHAGKGYMVNVAYQATLIVSGYRKSDALNLSEGWNYVGMPIDRTVASADVFASVESNLISAHGYDETVSKWKRFDFDPEKPGFLKNLSTIEASKAYWVNMYAAGTVPRHETLTENTFFFHGDHLGSNSIVTDMTGAVVEHMEFYPYGRVRYENRDGFESAYKYTDQEFDKESGLYNYNARLYGAGFGRFISADTVVPDIYDPQSLNRYAYCQNNPMKYTDPSGHFLAVGALIGGVIGGVIGGAAGAVNVMVNGGDMAKAVCSGALGGAAGGAITGSGAGLILALGARVGIGGAMAIGSSFGAAGGAVDNTVAQYSGHLMNGESPEQSFKKIDINKVKNSAKWGARFGIVSGSLAHGGKLFKAHNAVLKNNSSKQLETIRSSLPAASDDTIQVVFDKIGYGMAKVGSSENTILSITNASQVLGLEFGEAVTTNLTNEVPQ